MRRIIILISFSLCFGYNSLNITANWSINFYKKIISPLQGQNICNFSPSCSQFYKQSINKYGIVIGSLMGSDRLQRCNPWTWTYLDKYYSGVSNNRLNDPIENHYILSNKIQGAKLTTANNQMPTSNKERPKTELDFADYLFESKDYVRAIGEYKRILFSWSDTENTLKDYVNLMLGECYLTTKTYDQALYYFGSRDNPYYQYGAARTYFNQGEYATARNELKALENTKFDKERIILTGWSYYKQRDFSAGSLYFGGFSSDSQITRLSIYDGKGIAKRSRAMSTLFSAVIPGLGQTYSGRLGDGIYSLLTVVGSALIANYYYSNDESRIKFSIFTALTTFFWAGNVYGANISARDHNYFQQKKYLQQIEDELGQIELTPKYPK
jgi:hypothetical protein